MGTTKKHFYQKDQLLFSDLCKALGHPARVSIVQLLSKNNSLNCTDLQSGIQLSLPTISRHCKILHEAGIIGYEVFLNNCYFKLDSKVLDEITNFINEINTEIPSITGKVYFPRSMN